MLQGAKLVQGAESSKLASATESVDNLQNSLQQAEQVKAYLREQRQQLKAQLINCKGFGTDLTKLNKEAYYYNQQLNEYKNTLADRKKVEDKAVQLLKNLPAYNKFHCSTFPICQFVQPDWFKQYQYS